jgi:phospholipid/cholesterol/gamma-HCH transport system permease protein
MQEDNTAFCTLQHSASVLTLKLHGEWIVDHVCEIEDILQRIIQQSVNPSILSITDRELEEFDLSGAWILYRFCEVMKRAGYQPDLSQLHSKHLEFIDQIIQSSQEGDVPAKSSPTLFNRIAALGKFWLAAIQASKSFIGFLGQVFTIIGYCLLNPRKLRIPSIVRHIEETGFHAIPIVCLLAFLISIVLAYQGTTQLSRFGAEIYTIDLVAISVLREMGVLLTAIMVAGRSGSAFAAEIGVMKLNQEVAAMQTLGINPMHALMVPRTLALMLTLPMLTLFADIVGFVGGAVVAVISLDIPFSMFMERLHATVTLTHFMVGLSKAPVFAFVIAIIGIRQGFLVEHSAEDVGRNTTRAVVQSIFAVIAIDALFSIMTTELGY